MEKTINSIRLVCLWVLGLSLLTIAFGLFGKGSGINPEPPTPIPAEDVPPCLVNCLRCKPKNKAADKIYLLVQQADGTLREDTLCLSDIIMFTINPDGNGCAAYGPDHFSLKIIDRLSQITSQIETCGYSYFCQTNRRDLVNLIYLEKYNRCEKKVLLDDDLESPVTGDRGACIDKMVPVGL